MPPFGELTMKQLQGFMFTSRHGGYFKDHSLGSLPSEYVCRTGQLAESSLVDDVMVVLHNVERMFQEAEEYIYRLTDRYFMMALPQLEEATERGVEFRLLQSRGFEFPPDWPGEGVILKETRLNGMFKLRYRGRVHGHVGEGGSSPSLPVRRRHIRLHGFQLQRP